MWNDCGKDLLNTCLFRVCSRMKVFSTELAWKPLILLGQLKPWGTSHYWLLNLDDSSSERDFDGRSKYVTHFAPSRFLATDSSFNHQSKVIIMITEPLLKLRAHCKIISIEVFALGATLRAKKLIMKIAWKPLTRVGHKRTYLTALSVFLYPSMMHRRT